MTLFEKALNFTVPVTSSRSCLRKLLKSVTLYTLIGGEGGILVGCMLAFFWLAAVSDEISLSFFGVSVGTRPTFLSVFHFVNLLHRLNNRSTETLLQFQLNSLS